MAAKSTRLGPGEFTFGATGTPMDASCQLANGVVAWDKDAEDPITVLCGDTVPGSVTYTAAMSGNLLQDLAEEDGLVAYTWEHKGEAVPFTYTPNTAAGATVSGTIVIDPLDVGSEDDYGAVMSSDFEWDIVGTPVLSHGAAPVDATGATAGTPGTWTPSGSTPPANAAGATSDAVTANPTTAWTSGQYVQGSTAGSGGEMYWNGSAWTAGRVA